MIRRHLIDPANLTSTFSLVSALHLSRDPHELSSLGSGVIIDSASPEHSRVNILQDLSQVVEDLLRMPYAWWKRADSAYVDSRKTFLSSGPFKLWLSDDPLVNEQFILEESPMAAPSKARKATIAVKMDSVTDAERRDLPTSILHECDASRNDDISAKKARREQYSGH